MILAKFSLCCAGSRKSRQKISATILNKTKRTILQKAFRKLVKAVQIFAALFCLLIGFTAAYAQQRVNGEIINKATRTPIEGVSVRLESNLLETASTTTSDKAGLFSFAGLSPGRYSLSINVNAFYPVKTVFVVSPRSVSQ